MTYQEALRKAVEESGLTFYGAPLDEALGFMDSRVQFEIDLRDFKKSKGEDYCVSFTFQYLCDLKEGKTTEDRNPVLDFAGVGNMESVRKFCGPSVIDAMEKKAKQGR